MATIGELPVLVGQVADRNRHRNAHNLQGRAKVRLGGIRQRRILEEDLHARRLFFDVVVRRQDKIPSIEHLEEGIYKPFGNRTADKGHLTWPPSWRRAS